MAEHAGWARVASNWTLDRFAEAWFTDEGEENEWLSDMDLRKQFNAVKRDLFPWSRKLSQNVAKNAIIHTGKGLDAWGAYKKALKEGKCPRRVGFPKYRKRGRHMSFTPTNGRNTIRVEGCRVRIPATVWVRMREPLRFAGDILAATVSLEADRWFIAFQVDTGQPTPAPSPGPTIGVDMGIHTLATLWDGDKRTEIENPRPLQKALDELRRINQAIARSRKVHGTHRTSNRREALHAQRRRQYARVSHLRNDHHHQTTTAIAKRGGTVKVETLNIAGMTRNRRLGRAVSDTGMAGFVRMLEYKCAWYGTEFQRIDRWYPSSKTCSACGAVKQSLLLSERTYHCLQCGFVCDRDENAARNIQAFTPAARSAVTDVETRKSSRDTGPPGQRSVNQTGNPLPMYIGS
jgi:putative transposase